MRPNARTYYVGHLCPRQLVTLIQLTGRHHGRLLTQPAVLTPLDLPALIPPTPAGVTTRRTVSVTLNESGQPIEKYTLRRARPGISS